MAEVEELKFFKLKRSRIVRVFGLFEFDNCTYIDLTRYQIFHQADEEWDETEEPCLIHTLRLAGINEQVILHLKANIPRYFVKVF